MSEPSPKISRCCTTCRKWFEGTRTTILCPDCRQAKREQSPVRSSPVSELGVIAGAVRSELARRGLTVPELAERTRLGSIRLGRFIAGSGSLHLRDLDRVLVELDLRITPAGRGGRR